MSRSDLLRRIPLFSSLSDDELALLTERLRRRAFGKGVVIFHEGDPGEWMHIIESGRVRIFAASESGQEISVNIYGPGEVFGELSVLDGLPRSAGAIAIEDTVTLTLHRNDFWEQMSHSPHMARGIIQVLTRRLRYTTGYAESLAFLDVCGRVAARLLEMGERYGVRREGIEIELHLTQGELASWVGASRESVNKVLRLLHDQGAIDIRGSHITLLDEGRLRSLIVY